MPSSPAKGRGCSELLEEVTGLSRMGLSSQPLRCLLWPWPSHLNTLHCLVICKISILLFTHHQETQVKVTVWEMLGDLRGEQTLLMSAEFQMTPWAGSCKPCVFSSAWRPWCRGVSGFWRKASSWDGYFSGLGTKYCFLEVKLNHLCRWFCGLSHDFTYLTLQITKQIGKTPQCSSFKCNWNWKTFHGYTNHFLWNHALSYRPHELCLNRTWKCPWDAMDMMAAEPCHSSYFLPKCSGSSLQRAADTC